MNAIEKALEFQKQHSELIHHALNDGVPLPNMIMALSDQEFELRMILRTIRQTNAVEDMASKIIPAPTGMKLPKLPPSN